MSPTVDQLDHESCYSRREVARPPLRRRLLHRGAHHRHLLPAQLPGADAGVQERHLLPDGRSRAGRRLPGLQALPPRRHPGQPRLGRRRRRGRSRDAADRRRRRRPRGRRGPGPPGRLHLAPPHPAAHRPARAPARSPWPGRSARRPRGPWSRPPTCRCPTSRSRPASRASGSSTRPCARSTRMSPSELRGRRRGGARPATGQLDLRLAVRTPFAGDALLAFLAYHLVPGVEAAGPGWYARTLDLPHGPGTVRLALPQVDQRGRDRLRRRDVHAHRRARHRRGGRAGPPAGRRRLRPGRGRRPLRRRPRDRPARAAYTRACACPVRSTATRSPCAPSSASRSAWSAPRTVTGRLVAAHGRPVETDIPGLTHLFPDAATIAGARPGDAADAAGPGPRAGRARCRAGRRETWRSTAAPTATTYAGGCSSCPASGPGRPTTSRCARSATPTSSCPTDLGRPQRARRSRPRARRRTPAPGRPGAPTR